MKYNQATVDKIYKLIDDGDSYPAVAKKLKMNLHSVLYYVKKRRAGGPVQTRSKAPQSVEGINQARKQAFASTATQGNFVVVPMVVPTELKAHFIKAFEEMASFLKRT